jgi:protein-L-isoaspartate O-methyltransferase
VNCEQEGLVVGRSIPSAETLRQIFSVLQLPPDPKTLQIGVGLGYASAVLAHVARQVIGIEKVASLASAAKDKLNNLNLANVVIHQGDGRDGAPQEAPFDIIVVTTPQY